MFFYCRFWNIPCYEGRFCCTAIYQILRLVNSWSPNADLLQRRDNWQKRCIKHTSARKCDFIFRATCWIDGTSKWSQLGLEFLSPACIFGNREQAMIPLHTFSCLACAAQWSFRKGNASSGRLLVYLGQELYCWLCSAVTQVGKWPEAFLLKAYWHQTSILHGVKWKQLSRVGV